ncbi:MAG TPA: hypothetical protein VMF87_10595 [Streptosporangiaceae bacterium]|nr:hypothetical protein [Streptosporangiaceae bacterium]
MQEVDERWCRARLDISGHGRLTGIFAPFRVERGEAVGLRLDPAGCHVFPAAAAADSAGAAAPEQAAEVPLSAVGPE